MDIHVNAAMSVDGKLSTTRREQLDISGSADFDRVDQLRAESEAILVGIGTVLADDPTLAVDVDRDTQPVRVVVDTRARMPLDAAVLEGVAETIVVVGDTAPTDRINALENEGATVIVAGADRVDLTEAMAQLDVAGIDELLVEGGGEIVFSLFAADLVDSLTLYVGSVIIGGRDAPTLADGEGFTDPSSFATLTLDSVDTLDDGVLLTYDTP